MPSLHRPEPPDDDSFDDDEALDTTNHPDLDLDSLPGLDVATMGITLRDPAIPRSPPLGVATHRTNAGGAFASDA